MFDSGVILWEVDNIHSEGLTKRNLKEIYIAGVEFHENGTTFSERNIYFQFLNSNKIILITLITS